MIGAIAGDIIGSIFERSRAGAFPDDAPLFARRSRFTDDTVLTVALADAILSGRSFTTLLKEYGRAYPDAGYGGTFKRWMYSDNAAPYGSWGNGSAMRVSPVAYAFETLDEVLAEAEKSAAVTRDHPEGIKGAQAVASSVFLARNGASREAIREYVEQTFGYDLSRTIDEIRVTYEFDVSCQGSVPQAIRAFLEAESFEDAVRKAISIGGDSDTIAYMAGAIAEPFFGGMPVEIEAQVFEKLDHPLATVTRAFTSKFPVGRRAVDS